MDILTLNNLNKSFQGLKVTKSISLKVKRGERRLIIGPNGAGKTTLFNLISGDITPDSGEIYFLNQDITALPNWKRAQLGLSRTFQIITLFPNASIGENLELSITGVKTGKWQLWPFKSNKSSIKQRIIDTLKEVNLLEIQHKNVEDTSYGEQRRLEIAMALIQSPQLLLLDEPFAGLSTEERQHVSELILNIDRSVTILMIEHDMDLALGLADQITLLNYGEVVVEGNRATISANSKAKEIYLGK